MNERFEYVEIPGACIRDRDSEIVYEATIGTGRGGAWLTSLSITTTRPDQRINNALLASVPTKAIAHAVESHLREVAESGHEGVFNTSVRPRGDKPDLRQIAEDYPKHTRVSLAARYGVSPSTIDRWVAEARAHKLLPPATTGRPRAKVPGPVPGTAPPRRPGGNRPSGKPKKEQNP